MRCMAAALLLLLLWPTPAAALRPLSAGQEESAMSRLRHALVEGGLEESGDSDSPSIRQYERRRSLLEAWGYRAFIVEYMRRTLPQGVVESPVFAWHFEERDMEKWLQGQAPTVQLLKDWAAKRWVRPVWWIDDQKRTPVDFAATVAFQEPHRLSGIADALRNRQALVNDVLEQSNVGQAIVRRLVILSPHFFQAMVPWPGSHSPVVVAAHLLHQTIGWWQYLHEQPLYEPMPQETIERIARQLLKTIGGETRIPSLEQDNEAVADAYLYWIARDVPETVGLEEWPAPETLPAPSAVEAPDSIRAGA